MSSEIRPCTSESSHFLVASHASWKILLTHFVFSVLRQLSSNTNRRNPNCWVGNTVSQCFVPHKPDQFATSPSVLSAGTERRLGFTTLHLTDRNVTSDMLCGAAS